jgi:hypothetical protein
MAELFMAELPHGPTDLWPNWLDTTRGVSEFQRFFVPRKINFLPPVA